MLFNLFLDTVLREMQPELIHTGLAYFYWLDGVLREMPSRIFLVFFGKFCLQIIWP